MQELPGEEELEELDEENVDEVGSETHADDRDDHPRA